jgi:hypothetical protein
MGMAAPMVQPHERSDLVDCLREFQTDFFLKDRRIVRPLRHDTIADEPDYLKLVGAG